MSTNELPIDTKHDNDPFVRFQVETNGVICLVRVPRGRTLVSNDSRLVFIKGGLVVDKLTDTEYKSLYSAVEKVLASIN